jgi:preprotein translocase subunit SecB
MSDAAAFPADNGAAGAQPQLRVLAQYVKDMSFENPGAPQSLRAGQDQPAIDLQIDVNAIALADGPGLYEVALRMKANATRGTEVVFIAELVYAGLFEFQNISGPDFEPILLIECPRTIFPFARRVLADMTREGGHMPLMLDPIDFVSLYRAQLDARQQQQPAS